MFCYLWHEKTDHNECKFGERWVKAGQDPRQEVLKRIKDSVGVRKDKIHDGTIELVAIWDVSELAQTQCPERFKQHGRVDDYIREHIGFRKGNTGEVHLLDATDMAYRVNEFLKRVGQPLPLAGLSQNQHDAAVNVVESVAQGRRTIVAELCARFGKTIWSGALIRETGAPLTVIASYVLTSFASFKKDLSSFEQFRGLRLIEAGADQWQEQAQAALDQDQQTVVFLSMCAGGRRQDKIDWLFGRDANKLVIVDEADFGVHQIKQSQPLIEARTDQDVVILMTGTNGDRAASIWPVDHYLSVTYPELLIEKHQDRLASHERSDGQLRHFAVDASRHQLYVDVEFYQMNLASVVNIARQAEPDAFLEDGIFLPSWSKFATKPVKAKGFFTNMLQAIFEGRGGDDSLNVDFQTGRRAREGIKVAMMFLPGSTTNANLEEIVPIAQQALKGFEVVAVYGEEMTNATAERRVRERIEQAESLGQHVLIISAGMAQRSFSIPHITELYLAYDSGDSGATIQKMSRTLTPHQEGKVGRVISLSFDPNRDDKFDSIMLETAQNYKRNHGIQDLKQALRDVLRTVDIFRCQADGAVKIEIDQYLEEALARNSVDRVIGKIAPINELSREEIAALASGNADVFRAARQEAAQRGRTHINTVKKSRGADRTDANEKELARAREMVVTIAQNIDIIRYYGGSTIEEAFAIMDQEGKGIQEDVSRQFGVDYALIKELVLTNFINRDLLDLKFA